jgi:hypothetical protein
MFINQRIKKMSNRWMWIYGDECDELWKHFDMEDRNSDDRIKVKLIDFEEKEE